MHKRNGQFTMFKSGVRGLHAVEADTRRTFARHTHDQFGIGVIEHGAQKSLSDRGMVEAGPGDIITVNPGEVHDGAPIGDGGRKWKILYFDPWFVFEAVHDISEGRAASHEFSHPVLHDSRLARRLRALFSRVAAGRAAAFPLLHDELLLRLFADAMRELPRPAAARMPPAAVRAAQCRIDDDPTAPITLDELARESGMSRFQLLRAFSRSTGLTPHAYLVQRRTQLARSLLASGMPPAAAAASSGFADQSHMTRVFVAKYGVTPRAYADAVI